MPKNGSQGIARRHTPGPVLRNVSDYRTSAPKASVAAACAVAGLYDSREVQGGARAEHCGQRTEFIGAG
ncbi:hypothetical protein NDU88_001819 [Pleurodeles waltl]|uniref:Uncharacterized protein n=1 Tax=Pleurodeles waltl TaxID=8319 RepID=A0AAV7TJT1_PLEWA|nr:hypothetical protein NDU88_001819 [Pleurodeles waltl]